MKKRNKILRNLIACVAVCLPFHIGEVFATPLSWAISEAIGFSEIPAGTGPITGPSYDAILTLDNLGTSNASQSYGVSDFVFLWLLQAHLRLPQRPL